MNVTFTYFDTVCDTQSGDIDMALAGVSDLPVGLGTVRSFAAKDPAIAGRVRMTNRMYAYSTTEEEMVEGLLATSPDLIAFSCYLWNAERIYKVCEAVKRRAPGVRTVIGGPEIPRDAEGLGIFLEGHPSIDVAVGGEGEEAFADLLRSYLSGGDGEGIAGLGCRRDGSVRVSPPRPPLDDLSGIPSPYLTGDVQVFPESRGFLLVETSRGCPLTCAFCDYHLGRHAVRDYPLERLEAEFELLASKGFQGTVCFTDPILNLKRARFKKVLQLLIDYKMDRPVFDLHPEMFDDESIALMGRIPSPKVYLGIQSSDPATMKNINRPFNMPKITENIAKLCRHPNVQVTLETILGLPGDDYETFKRTMDWALSFRPRPFINLFDLLIIPNAPLYWLRDKFEIKTDEKGLVRRNCTFSEQDMVKASWLYNAYLYVNFKAGSSEKLDRLLGQARMRPSEVMERLGTELVKKGVFKDERLTCQYGWLD